MNKIANKIVVLISSLFLLVINKARKYCEEGKIVTFGVVPTSPEIGYGYINASVPIESSLQAYPIENFIEKPKNLIILVIALLIKI